MATHRDRVAAGAAPPSRAWPKWLTDLMIAGAGGAAITITTSVAAAPASHSSGLAAVALIDIRMPRRDGLALTRDVVSDPELFGVAVIVLTTFDTNQYIFDAIRAGAKGFLTKTVTKDELCRAVRVVAEGEAILSPSVTNRVLHEVSQRPSLGQPATDRLSRLTTREREVLAMIAAGKNNTEIGDALHISPLTAKTHVSRIIVKLRLRDRAQLVALAYETGLIRPGEGSAAASPTGSAAAPSAHSR